MPSTLTQPLASHHAGLPIKVFAQDETRLGLQPLLRRRMTACGVQPVAPVWPRCDTFDRCGAVEPLTGDRFFLALPLLNRAMVQRWLDNLAQTCAASLNSLGLDHGALHTAKTLRWPPHVAAVPLPPSSPELNPMERLWRDLQDQLADPAAQALDDLAITVCRLLQTYAPAALKSLTGVAYFVQAVQTALQTKNGWSQNENHITPLLMGVVLMQPEKNAQATFEKHPPVA